MRSLPVSSTSRRRFLAGAAGLVASIPAGPFPLARLLAQARCTAPTPTGDLIRTLPLYGPGSQDAPLGQVVGGEGLDARLFTDLSTLSTDSLKTPAHGVFVRTMAPADLDLDPHRWHVRLGDGEGTTVTAAALARESTAMGTHLIECAGNSNPQHFGLMSAVAWDGVPLGRVLDRLRRPPGAWGVLVTGADPTVTRTARSVPGASWIIPGTDIQRRAPFLATGIDGQALTPNHGAPVRLVIPGWYGCAWIKWVTGVRWVTEDAASTSQMLEYAVRTHQEGRPAHARDYAPPVIDTAAMPVRVEQRRVDGRIEYQVVGVVWGGDVPVDRLVIRFGPRDQGEPVELCPAPTTTRTWALWTHRWRPAQPGYYDISLKAADPRIPTRRLDLSFYIRRVRIDEV
jgi:DMSO/TMAO reductase YedYZ molybdopterin-dependent catalytic subunit